MKYRIKYTKTDNLKFISHLDILKVLQRAFRRSGIDLVHSQGFNPHPKIHFAPPLPLFTESLGEYVDIETKEDFSAEEIIQAMNENLPDNLRFISADILDDNAKSLGKSIDRARYRIELRYDERPDVQSSEIEKYVNGSESIIIKKLNKKKRTVEKDIKPGVTGFSCRWEDSTLMIETDLSMRAELIISPNALISAINARFPETSSPASTRLLKKDTILF